MPSNQEWESFWKTGDTGWHSKNVHPMLEKYAGRFLNDQSNCRVFIPLCGKTVDMKWLADLGHDVVGAEIAKMPILNFFEEQSIEYVKESVPEIPGATRYKSKDGKITIYEADLFSMKKDIIGQFDCIWDRGSLVAMEKADRQKYICTMIPLMASDCRYLLAVYDYDSTKASGPPFDVPNSVVAELYEPTCVVEKLDTSKYGPFEDCVRTVFLLKPN
ncbi:probable thiopurine S-methyltransferase [Antedon mediterranea]|uniref:probable thiopurine S-methyltransferase n=1 Tax=Antedon mediterranea TaxID=105859 RepID=UPI003AF4BEAC